MSLDLLSTKYENRTKSHFFNTFFMEKLYHTNEGYNYDSIKRFVKLKLL